MSVCLYIVAVTRCLSRAVKLCRFNHHDIAATPKLYLPTLYVARRCKYPVQRTIITLTIYLYYLATASWSSDVFYALQCWC